MADATPTAVDPRDALYYANQAALNFQREGTLNADKRGREEAETGYNYGRSQIAKARPLALTANRNTANNQGLLESGVLAQRQGQTETGFTTREGQLGETRAKAIARYNKEDKTAQQAYELGENKGLAEAGERYKANLIQNPPAPEGATAANRGGTRDVLGPPGAGGVVPYNETIRNGKGEVTGGVRVGPGTPITKFSKNPDVRARQIAANKALGVG